MYFPKYGLSVTRLDRYLKSVVSHYPSRINIVNAHKHCSYLHVRTVGIVTGHCKEY